MNLVVRSTRSTRKLTINEASIITVIGKAFWDVGHAPKDQSNRRSHQPDVLVGFDSMPFYTFLLFFA